MLEGAGGLLLKLAQNRAGSIAELVQAVNRYKVEYLLEKIGERISGHAEEGGEKQHPGSPQQVPSGKVGKLETEEHGEQHREGDDGIQELAPSLVEVFEGNHRDYPAGKEDGEHSPASLGIEKQRQQGDGIGHHHQTVVEEGLKQQCAEHEGNHEQVVRMEPGEDYRQHREDGEDEREVEILAIVAEDRRIHQPDSEEEENHEQQRNDSVPQPEEEGRGGSAHAGVVLLQVGGDDLVDLGRNYLILLDYVLAGADIT